MVTELLMWKQNLWAYTKKYNLIILISFETFIFLWMEFKIAIVQSQWLIGW